MAFGGVPLWADGRLTLRVRGPGFGTGRPLTIPRPFALLGRGEGADICIDDPTVSTRHAYLHMDRRGIFVVDLATRTGLRFDDVAGSAGWLRPGQALEVAGRRIEIVSAQVDGVSSFVGPVPRSLLANSADPALVRLTLRDGDATETPWTIDSELLFIGRSPSCGVRIAGEGTSRIHCVIIRGADAAYLVDLSGRGVVLNGQPTSGAAALADGDRLHIGATRFTVHVAAPSRVDDAVDVSSVPAANSDQTLPALRAPESNLPELLDPSAPLPAELVPPLPPDFPGGESQAAVLGWMMGVLQATQGEMMRRQDDFQREVVQALREMHQDNQDVMSRHLKKGDRIQSDLSALRDEIRQRYGSATAPTSPIASQAPGLPKPPPLRIAPLPTASPDSEAATSWLLNRVNQLDAENRSSWRDLLSRISNAPKT